MKKIVAAIGGESELREQDDDRLAIHRLAHQRERLIGVEGGVGDAHGRNPDGDAHEIVIIQVVEV